MNEAAEARSSVSQMIGTQMTMGRICAFGVCSIGVDCRETSVFESPIECSLYIDRMAVIVIRLVQKHRRKTEGVDVVNG